MAVEAKYPFELLQSELGEPFDAIAKARVGADNELAALGTLLANGANKLAGFSSLTPPDTSIVFFGSLARREWTAGSDIDWTLLVDGQADPQHRHVSKEFKTRLANAQKKGPGPAQVFGGLSFSHELIHCIGGEHDTNTNLTRRILLLLESRSLSPVDSRSRVVRGILNPYLDSERSFLAETGRKYRVPRFLLNDIVRYWRTMAVDYVSKQWERGDEGWALRNIKLRFSRKLLFVSGLLTCFSCYLDQSIETSTPLFLKDQREAGQAVHQHVSRKLEDSTPLDLLSEHLRKYARKETAKKILVAYDAFLATINDLEKRDHLSTLKPENSYADSIFDGIREKSHDFQLGIIDMFYNDNTHVRELMQKYGVF